MDRRWRIYAWAALGGAAVTLEVAGLVLGDGTTITSLAHRGMRHPHWRVVVVGVWAGAGAHLILEPIIKDYLEESRSE